MGRLGDPKELEALVARIRAGDRAAWTELYERTRPYLRACIRHSLGHGPAADEDLVEELLQEVWCSSPTGPDGVLEGYQPGHRSVTRYLVGRVRVVVRDRMRSERRRHGWEEAGARPEAQPSPLTERQVALLLANFLAWLSPSLREYYAEYMQRPQSPGPGREPAASPAERQRLRRIRLALRDYLASVAAWFYLPRPG